MRWGIILLERTRIRDSRILKKSATRRAHPRLIGRLLGIHGNGVAMLMEHTHKFVNRTTEQGDDNRERERLDRRRLNDCVLVYTFNMKIKDKKYKSNNCD